MSEPLHILLLDHTADLTKFPDARSTSFQAIICLFWIAPLTQATLSEEFLAPCYGLKEIVNDLTGEAEEAYKLVTEVTTLGPRFGELYWRTYLTETLFNELMEVSLLAKVGAFIEKLSAQRFASFVSVHSVVSNTTVTFLRSLLPGKISILPFPGQEPLQESGTRQHQQTIWKRLGERAREAYLMGNWGIQISDFISWLDKTYYWHCQLGHFVLKQTPPQGTITFFSSYRNNTRTLASFNNLMPMPIYWLLANDSARYGLPVSAKSAWLWQFSDRSTDSELSSARAAQTVEQFQLPDHNFLQTWLQASPSWLSWQNVEFSLVRNLTRCWEAYLDQAKPRLVVLTNQWGIEGWFMDLARQRGIPVLQLMHGMMASPLYLLSPVRSDLLVVWGDFWRELWPQQQRDKIFVFNPTSRFAAIPRQPGGTRYRLTFFSWPLKVIARYNASELLDGFIHILHELLDQHNFEITVRIHPLEDVTAFKDRWQQHYGQIPPVLHIDKYGLLADILAQTDIALMFHSTVMLDCLALGIPIVMPGWIDLGFNKSLVAVPGITFAKDFNYLREILLSAPSRQSTLSPENAQSTIESLVAPTGQGLEQMQQLISNLVESGAHP